MVKNARRVVTQKDIARLCRVSMLAVSRVLRGDVSDDDSVAVEQREAILSAAHRLGYRTDRSARRLAQVRYGQNPVTHIAAMALPVEFYTVRYFTDLFVGVMEYFQSAGYALLTTTHRLPGDPAGGGRGLHVNNLVRHGVDGLIFQGPLAYEGFVDDLRADPGFGHRPLISFGHRRGCAEVVSDDRSGGRQAMEYLLALGHRHVLLYVLPGEPRSDAQHAGVTDALRAAGLDPSHHCHGIPLIAGWNNPGLFRDGLRLSERLASCDPAARDQLLSAIRGKPTPTAVLAINDANALNAWFVLRDAGLRIPQDVSIIGFDDTDPMTDANGKNMLTSVRVPLIKQGEEAARLFLRMVAGQERADTVVTVPVELMVRESTAPIAKH